MDKRTIRDYMAKTFGFAPALKDINITSECGNIYQFTVNGREYSFNYEKMSFTVKAWVCSCNNDYEYSLARRCVTIPRLAESPEFYIRNCHDYWNDYETLAAVEYYAGTARKKFDKMKDSTAKKQIAADILNYIEWRDDIWAYPEYSPENITDESMKRASSCIGWLASYDYDTHSIPAKIIGDIMGIPVEDYDIYNVMNWRKNNN